MFQAENRAVWIIFSRLIVLLYETFFMFSYLWRMADGLLYDKAVQVQYKHCLSTTVVPLARERDSSVLVVGSVV